MRHFSRSKSKNIILKSIFEKTKLKFVTFLDANTTHLKLHMHWSWVDIFKTGYRSISLSIWITFRQNNVAARLGSRSSITFFSWNSQSQLLFFPEFYYRGSSREWASVRRKKKNTFSSKNATRKNFSFSFIYLFLYIFLLLLSPLLGMENLPGWGE